jgi:hypothetical protein
LKEKNENDTQVVPEPEQKQSAYGNARMLGEDARDEKPMESGFSYDWSSLSFVEREGSIPMKCTFGCDIFCIIMIRYAHDAACD